MIYSGGHGKIHGNLITNAIEPERTACAVTVSTRRLMSRSRSKRQARHLQNFSKFDRISRQGSSQNFGDLGVPQLLSSYCKSL